MLAIDLTTGRIDRTEYPPSLTRHCLGGRGTNAWFLARQLGPDVDPLGADNLLLFSCGLLTGTAAPSSSRLHVGARSPLTGLLGSSNVGGYLGAELRAAGVLTLLVRGRASHPVYLWIDGDRAELRDAAHLWGLDTRDTTDRLQAELGRSREDTSEPGRAFRLAMSGGRAHPGQAAGVGSGRGPGARHLPIQSAWHLDRESGRWTGLLNAICAKPWPWPRRPCKAASCPSPPWLCSMEKSSPARTPPSGPRDGCWCTPSSWRWSKRTG